MKIKKYKHNDNVFIVLHQFVLYDIIVPKNALMYYQSSEKTWYICTRFPRNYKGDVYKMRLNVIWFDTISRTIGEVCLKHGRITRAIADAYVGMSMPKTKVYHETNYEELMKHSRAHKKSTGGVRLREDVSEEVTDGVKYRQGSKYAYYSQLGAYNIVLE